MRADQSCRSQNQWGYKLKLTCGFPHPTDLSTGRTHPVPGPLGIFGADHSSLSPHVEVGSPNKRTKHSSKNTYTLHQKSILFLFQSDQTKQWWK